MRDVFINRGNGWGHWFPAASLDEAREEIFDYVREKISGSEEVHQGTMEAIEHYETMTGWTGIYSFPDEGLKFEIMEED